MFHCLQLNLLRRYAVILTSCLLAGPAFAIDVAQLWDYSNPELSEKRFRSALSSAVADDVLILQTQIARTYMLRKDFDQARTVLADIEARIPTASAEAQVRYWLELGRSYASHQHSEKSQTAESVDKARTAFTKALTLAKDARLDGLAIDAVHMFVFVDKDLVDQLARGEEALALIEASEQIEAKRWKASVLNNMGEALFELQRFDEALKHFKLALSLRQNGGSAKAIRDAHWQIARVLRLLQQTDEAIAIQRRLEEESAAAGEQKAYIFAELQLLYQAKGDTERAKHYAVLAESMAKNPH
jgi:tetratricopeptide (TPR) repeat protein